MEDAVVKLNGGDGNENITAAKIGNTTGVDVNKFKLSTQIEKLQRKLTRKGRQ